MHNRILLNGLTSEKEDCFKDTYVKVYSSLKLLYIPIYYVQYYRNLVLFDMINLQNIEPLLLTRCWVTYMLLYNFVQSQMKYLQVFYTKIYSFIIIYHRIPAQSDMYIQ